MQMQLHSRITVHDIEGRIVQRGRWRRSHSFVKQFVQILQGLFTSIAGVQTAVIDTAGATQNIWTELYWTITQNKDADIITVNASQGNALFGLVVGTDNGSTYPHAVDNYKLGTQIAEGVGAAQMEHMACSVSSVSVMGSVCSLTISRVFVNSSGASITVNEFGIYVKCSDRQSTIWYLRYLCIARDLIAGGQVVAHGQSITIEYKISATA